MPFYPHAIQKGPLPTSNFAVDGVPKIGVVNHVIVGSAQSAIGEFLSPGSQLSAHFVVDFDGTAYQLLDTNLCCYAQAAGNYPPTAYIAIEYAGTPDTPMTDAQILTGAAITAWASAQHFFPIVGVVQHGHPGVTTHCNPDGSADPNWGNHSCPGQIRLAQIPKIIYLAYLVSHPTPTTQPPPPHKESNTMAATVPTGGILVTRPDGGVFAEAGAQYHGSVHQYDPNKPSGGSNAITISSSIVGIAPTKTGKGYWLAGADGAVYGFGDAAYHGSGTGNPSWGIGTASNPVVGIVTDPSKVNGYVLIADSGTGAPATYYLNETTNFK